MLWLNCCYFTCTTDVPGFSLGQICFSHLVVNNSTTLLSHTRESCNSPSSQSLALLFKSKAHESVDSDCFRAHVQDMCHIESFSLAHYCPETTSSGWVYYLSRSPQRQIASAPATWRNIAHRIFSSLLSMMPLAEQFSKRLPCGHKLGSGWNWVVPSLFFGL